MKTDRRDAERLVGLLMIGGLHPVRLPCSEEEVPRDPVARGTRLGKLLLRHDLRYDGAGDNWTHRHRQWLSTVRLLERGEPATLLHYLGAIDALIIHRGTLEATISELAVSRCARHRAAAVPARDRHLARGRAVRRDHRLRAFETQRS